MVSTRSRIGAPERIAETSCYTIFVNIVTYLAGWQICTPEQTAAQNRNGLIARIIIGGLILFGVFILRRIVISAHSKPNKIALSLLVILLTTVVCIVVGFWFALTSPWCNP
jgi:hypothetical protein